MPKTFKSIIYVDGFNLYYGTCAPNSAKWLNIEKLVQMTLPANEIVGLKYYTARVRATDTDPSKDTRQQTYIRALQTIPNFEVFYGHFLESNPMAKLVPPIKCGKRKHHKWTIRKVEEKGSDVNLAAHLLMDGWKGAYDAAIVITNDSDLKTPINIVRTELKKPVVVLNPHPNNASRQLASVASRTYTIRSAAALACLFPDTITATDGRKITKPKGW
jgi:uncharacterized LabA/DUF88 family protein